MRTLAALFGSVLVSVAYAADPNASQVEGKIAAMHVSGHGFSVTLVQQPKMCGTSSTSAYVSSEDKSYDAFVSTLLAAKTDKWTVAVSSEKDSNGLCRINGVEVR